MKRIVVVIIALFAVNFSYALQSDLPDLPGWNDVSSRYPCADTRGRALFDEITAFYTNAQKTMRNGVTTAEFTSIYGKIFAYRDQWTNYLASLSCYKSPSRLNAQYIIPDNGTIEIGRITALAGQTVIVTGKWLSGGAEVHVGDSGNPTVGQFELDVSKASNGIVIISQESGVYTIWAKDVDGFMEGCAFNLKYSIYTNEIAASTTTTTLRREQVIHFTTNKYGNLVIGGLDTLTGRWATNTTQPFFVLQAGLFPPLQLPGKKTAIFGVSAGAFMVSCADLYGFQVAGFAADIGNDGGILQTSLIWNHVGHDFAGFQVSLAFNNVENNMIGAQVGFDINYVGGNLYGFQFGGGLTEFIMYLTTRGRSNASSYSIYSKFLGNFVQGNLYGFQIAGVINSIFGDGYGFQLSPVINYSGSSFVGLQMSCGFNKAAGDFIGIQTSLLNVTDGREYGIVDGLFNRINGESYGIVSGLINYARWNGILFGALYNGDLKIMEAKNDGLTIGGVFNWFERSSSGVMLTGGLNFVKDGYYGIQIGAGNVAVKNFIGFQAGLYNHAGAGAGGTDYGMQVGAFNNAAKFNGVQIGIVNIVDSLCGVQIGLVNISRHGGLRFMAIMNVGGMDAGLENDFYGYYDYLGKVTMIDGEIRFGGGIDIKYAKHMSLALDYIQGGFVDFTWKVYPFKQYLWLGLGNKFDVGSLITGFDLAALARPHADIGVRLCFWKILVFDPYFEVEYTDQVQISFGGQLGVNLLF